jgi:hypothetical protein
MEGSNAISLPNEQIAGTGYKRPGKSAQNIWICYRPILALRIANSKRVNGNGDR